LSPESPIDAAQAARRQAEVERDESERRYRHLLEHSLGLICVHDLAGRLVSVNPAAARSPGYEPADAAQPSPAGHRSARNRNGERQVVVSPFRENLTLVGNQE
jgi:PAS domain-containing protein